MADSAPAFAPSPQRSTPRSICDPIATEALAARPRSAAKLAFEAQGELDQLCDVQLAYACIEQLLDPDWRPRTFSSPNRRRPKRRTWWSTNTSA